MMSRKMRLNVVNRRLLEENSFAFDADEVPRMHTWLQTKAAVVFGWNLVEELWTGVGLQIFKRARAHWLYTSQRQRTLTTVNRQRRCYAIIRWSLAR